MLQIENLAFQRNNHLLFDAVCCQMETGHILQVRGANGSGKSTLLRILAGYIQPEAGNILWHGKSIFQQRESYQQQLHYIGHHNGIKHHLTAYENLQLSAALRDTPCQPQQVAAVLAQVGLSHATTTHAMQLSAGQNRRLALARLLLHPAALWILDEPTTALDNAGCLLLTALLNAHVANGGSVILATHHALPLATPTYLIQLGAKHDA